MKQLHIKILIILITVICICNNAYCVSNTKDDFRDFQSTAKKLSKYLEKLDKIEIYTEQIGPGADAKYRNTKIIFDYSKKLKYIQKTEQEWREIEKRLLDYIQDDSSIYRDDAKLCLGILYASISIPGNLQGAKAAKAYNEIINEGNNLNVEEWIVDLYKDRYIGVIFKSDPYEAWTNNLSLDVRTIEYFRRYIISELLNAGQYQEANNIIDRLKLDPTVNKDSIDSLEKFLDEYN